MHIYVHIININPETTEMNAVKIINLKEINPFIRVIKTHTINKGFKTGVRYNKHYQLHYVLDGVGYFNINGKSYTSRKGDLCFWKPGEAHIIRTSSRNTVTVVGVQFDFTQNFASEKYPCAAYNVNNFKEAYINEIVKFNDFSGYPPYTKIKDYSLITSILSDVEKYFISGSKFSKEKASTKFKEFHILLAEEILDLNKNNQIIDNYGIISFINMTYNENYSNKYIAAKYGYHSVHLNRIVRDMTGISLHQYIIKLRIDQALHLLQNTNLPISQIALEVGYINPHYFSRIFKAKTGYPPSHFKSR